MIRRASVRIGTYFASQQVLTLSTSRMVSSFLNEMEEEGRIPFVLFNGLHPKDIGELKRMHKGSNLQLRTMPVRIGNGNELRYNTMSVPTSKAGVIKDERSYLPLCYDLSSKVYIPDSNMVISLSNITNHKQYSVMRNPYQEVDPSSPLEISLLHGVFASPSFLSSISSGRVNLTSPLIDQFGQAIFQDYVSIGDTPDLYHHEVHVLASPNYSYASTILMIPPEGDVNPLVTRIDYEKEKIMTIPVQQRKVLVVS